MGETTYETIETMLAAVLEETEDPDVHYKLRTALQLLVFLEDDHERALEALEDADLDEELRERLARLGYLG